MHRQLLVTYGHAVAFLQPTDASLPTGVIVGSAIIRKCIKNCDGPPTYEWHLSGVKRLKRPRKVKGKPQPVWFRSF